jgi:hypothetical protein
MDFKELQKRGWVKSGQNTNLVYKLKEISIK